MSDSRAIYNTCTQLLSGNYRQSAIRADFLIHYNIYKDDINVVVRPNTSAYHRWLSGLDLSDHGKRLLLHNESAYNYHKIIDVGWFYTTHIYMLVMRASKNTEAGGEYIIAFIYHPNIDHWLHITDPMYSTCRKLFLHYEDNFITTLLLMKIRSYLSTTFSYQEL